MKTGLCIEYQHPTCDLVWCFRSDLPSIDAVFYRRQAALQIFPREAAFTPIELQCIQDLLATVEERIGVDFTVTACPIHEQFSGPPVNTDAIDDLLRQSEEAKLTLPVRLELNATRAEMIAAGIERAFGPFDTLLREDGASGPPGFFNDPAANAELVEALLNRGFSVNLEARTVERVGTLWTMWFATIRCPRTNRAFTAEGIVTEYAICLAVDDLLTSGHPLQRPPTSPNKRKA